jgi:hypothetical protein
MRAPNPFGIVFLSLTHHVGRGEGRRPIFEHLVLGRYLVLELATCTVVERVGWPKRMGKIYHSFKNAQFYGSFEFKPIEFFHYAPASRPYTPLYTPLRFVCS